MRGLVVTRLGRFVLAFIAALVLLSLPAPFNYYSVTAVGAGLVVRLLVFWRRVRRYNREIRALDRRIAERVFRQ